MPLDIIVYSDVVWGSFDILFGVFGGSVLCSGVLCGEVYCVVWHGEDLCVV